MKKISVVNTVSLMILGITYLAFGARTLFDAAFPDTAVRVFGIMTLIALPVFVFTTVKLRTDKK